MSIHFSRSLRRIQANGSRRSLLLVILLVGVLGLWAAWFAGARVSVYATTAAARLEVDRENHPIDAPVAGRVTALRFAVGSAVRAGEVLLELDASPERLAQTEARAKLAPSALQIASLREELDAEQRALDGEQRSGQAARAESQARVDEATSAADLAAEEARRLATLRSSGLVSEMEAIRGAKAADARRDAARSAEFATQKLERDLGVRQQDRLARIARLKSEIAEIEGTRSEASAASDRLTYEIDQRLVRAPISGTLAELAPIKVGGIVAQGDRICTIVPDGALKVVALFEPAVALGRVRTGQAARVRLEGFPWTTFGSAPAHVARVSGELRDGQVRVELALDPSADSSIPLQHGLPAEVDVEVEAISPLAMVVRSVGSRMRLSAAAPPSIPR